MTFIWTVKKATKGYVVVISPGGVIDFQGTKKECEDYADLRN